MSKICSSVCCLALLCFAAMVYAQSDSAIKIPAPSTDGKMPLEKAMSVRRSVRSYADRQISLSQASQILWAAQGITDAGRGLRTAPSAGALYPIEVYLVSARIDSLNAGLYRYRPLTHDLILMQSGDIMGHLSKGLQHWAVEAPSIIVISAVYSRTSVKYGDRAERYVHFEVGHAAQNVMLQACALGLASGVIGAFDDDEMHSLLSLPEEESLLYVIPVGYKR